MEQKVLVVKNLTSDDENSALIETYLELAASEIINRAYPYNHEITEVPPKYDLLQCNAKARCRGANSALRKRCVSVV